MQWQFENPSALWGLFAVLLLFILMVAKGLQLKKTLSKRRVILLSLGFFFCVLGLARLQSGTQETMKTAIGSNLFIAIDISQSMKAEDISPSRLKFAKTVIQELVELTPKSKVAVYPFAQDGFIQIPLTNDHSIISGMLPTLSPLASSNQGTDYSESLQTLLDLIVRAENAATERGENWLPTQVFLLSDGESHLPVNNSILKKFRNKNIPVFAMGIGTRSGGKIPIRDRWGRAKFLTDQTGGEVVTKFSQDKLKQITSITKGEYFTGELNNVPKIAETLTQYLYLSTSRTKLKVNKEYYPILFTLALFLFLLEFSRGRWEFALRILPLALLIPGYALYAKLSEERDLAGRIESAPNEKFKAIHLYNLGTYYLENNKLEKAIESLQQSAYYDKDVTLRKRSLFNLGNAYLKMSQPKDAIATYLEAYQVNTGNKKFDKITNTRISENIELAAKMLQMMQKQQSQGEGDGESSQNPNQKDPKGPKKFRAEYFSDARKKRIFDLIASEEQQTQQRIQRKKNQKQTNNPSGKPW